MLKTICYGKEKEWKSRKKAEEFFLDAIKHSEGSEQLRYMDVYCRIREGKDVCTDDIES